MTIEQAEKIYKTAHPDKELISAASCEKYFIFKSRSKTLKDDLRILPLTAVEKSTGKLLAFNPLKFRDDCKNLMKIY